MAPPPHLPPPSRDNSPLTPEPIRQDPTPEIPDDPSIDLNFSLPRAVSKLDIHLSVCRRYVLTVINANSEAHVQPAVCGLYLSISDCPY
jgi:hypothetical protein